MIHSNRSMKSFVSVVLAFMVFMQLCISMVGVPAASADPITQTTVNSDSTVTFALPKSDVTITANGEFNNWTSVTSSTYTLTDLTDSGTYSLVIHGLTPNLSYAYKFLMNGQYDGAANQTAAADANGDLTLTCTPLFFMKGSIDGWSTKHAMTFQNGVWSYTTAALAAGNYEYKFIWNAPSFDNYFLDPTNATTANTNSSVTVPSTTPDTSPAPTADTFIDQPGGKHTWIAAGIQSWNINSTESQLKHLVGDFYAYSTVLNAGSYEFKIVQLGTWDGYSDNGGNYKFTLAAKTKVNFYLNESLQTAPLRMNISGVSGNVPQYVPALAENKWPRLVGSIQAVFGESAWSPSTANQLFVDYNFDNSIYKLQRTIPAGSYEAKVAFGPNGDESYGDAGNNLKLVTLDSANVTFTIDYSKSGAERNLAHDYVAAEGNFDGQIDSTKIVFDSRSITYKKPFGAIPEQSKDLTLRIAAKHDDVQLAKVELTNAGGVASSFDMKRATTVGDKDYFEVVIPHSVFQGIGVWGYKFILVDGPTKVEYGDDGQSGGAGIVSSEGAIPFNLTVYKSDFQTPDWMKNAVVYQIFPDRFFDGSKANNRAKIVDGYRGPVDSKATNLTAKNGSKLQFFDGGVPNDPVAADVWGNWSDLPENPDRVLPQNKPYYPNAKTDGVWTNEFYGGDIQGVQQKVNYLKSLGVT
ncbi:MAG: alpha-amylase, partial [Bacilli bacterium]|nr:alpha-amylase [Bacilli bacterium]